MLDDFYSGLDLSEEVVRLNFFTFYMAYCSLIPIPLYYIANFDYAFRCSSAAILQARMKSSSTFSLGSSATISKLFFLFFFLMFWMFINSANDRCWSISSFLPLAGFYPTYLELTILSLDTRKLSSLGFDWLFFPLFVFFCSFSRSISSSSKQSNFKFFSEDWSSI